MLKQLCKKKVYQADFDKLKKRREQEMNELKLTNFDNKENLNKEINELKKVHRDEINHWNRGICEKICGQILQHFMRRFVFCTVSATTLGTLNLEK